jgi:hypothetical protein
MQRRRHLTCLANLFKNKSPIFIFAVATLVVFEFLYLQVRDFQTGNTCLNCYPNMRNQPNHMKAFPLWTNCANVYV